MPPPARAVTPRGDQQKGPVELEHGAGIRGRFLGDEAGGEGRAFPYAQGLQPVPQPGLLPLRSGAASGIGIQEAVDLFAVHKGHTGFLRPGNGGLIP